MKKYFASFTVSCVFLAAFASGQSAAPTQSDSPRKADAQFVSDYDAAKKINDAITAANVRAAEKLERENRPRRIQLEGLTAELRRKMGAACADVPQGCRYEETLHVFVPLPPAPKGAPQQSPQPPNAPPAAPTPQASAPPASTQPAPNGSAPADEKK